MQLLCAQHVASAPDNRICLWKDDSYINPELPFHNFTLMQPTHVHCGSAHTRTHTHTLNHRPLVALRHVWAFPARRHQKTRLRPVCIPPRPRVWHRDMDGAGLEWTAAGVPCILCLSWEEKFANGTDTGSRQREREKETERPAAGLKLIPLQGRYLQQHTQPWTAL